jgi:YhcH/YjgK/YiaL family protein
MIKGNINDYSGILSEYVDIIKGISPDHPLGKFELSGGAYYNVVISKSRKEEDALYEAHRKYIDLQYILSKSEVMGCAPLSSAKEVTPYSEENDCAFYTADGSFETYNEGDFVIFFTDDAHMPAVGEGECKKVIIKVPVK